MKVIIDEGLHRKTTEFDYTPTPAEVYFYYSGTHAGVNRDNPYAVRGGMVTTTRYTKVNPQSKSKPEKGN